MNRFHWTCSQCGSGQESVCAAHAVAGRLPLGHTGALASADVLQFVLGGGKGTRAETHALTTRRKDCSPASTPARQHLGGRRGRGHKEDKLEFTCAGWGCAQKLPDWAKGKAPVRANEPNLDCTQGLSENQARPHRGLPALRLNPGQSGLHALQDGLQVIKPFLAARQP